MTIAAFRKFSFVITLGALLLVFSVVKAQNNDQQSGGSGLLISPTRTEITANPGEKKEFTITLRNVTQTDLTANAILNDFESDGVSGTPQIIVDESQRSPNSLRQMIGGLSNIDLKPNQVKEIKLTLDVPGNASPGAYFGTVRYSAVPKNNQPSAERQVSLTASLGHLVLLEVPGDITEQIQLEKLSFQRDNTGGFFFWKAPNKANLAVKNLGNGFSRPFGNVTVKNMFGRQVFNYLPNDTIPRGIVLPNSSRTFTNDISGVKLPGRYTAVAAVAYGNGGEVITYQTAFWYVPTWLIVLLLILIIAGSYFGYRKYQARYGFKSKPHKKRK